MAYYDQELGDEEIADDEEQEEETLTGEEDDFERADEFGDGGDGY